MNAVVKYLLNTPGLFADMLASLGPIMDKDVMAWEQEVKRMGEEQQGLIARGTTITTLGETGPELVTPKTLWAAPVAPPEPEKEPEPKRTDRFDLLEL